MKVPSGEPSPLPLHLPSASASTPPLPSSGPTLEAHTVCLSRFIRADSLEQVARSKINLYMYLFGISHYVMPSVSLRILSLIILEALAKSQQVEKLVFEFEGIKRGPKRPELQANANKANAKRSRSRWSFIFIPGSKSIRYQVRSTCSSTFNLHDNLFTEELCLLFSPVCAFS